ncbi:aquaporin family protein [Methanogenium sp. S4BF]|uniref:MIP/aquaporin family protein n=1 Tax=Methanogenium sp. S4BF TaxID=1789226 RepID=UPI002415F627|nr:MIP/aquaporin family protein [Methanogenium sp. S4BF]WFN33810.1 aquaporin family protein [Methanogenium sp. S4BF]
MASLMKRSVAELVGTMLLVYFGCGAAVITLTTAARESGPLQSLTIGSLGGLGDWLAIGLAFGIVIAAVIYGLGRVSGAHINPAVTIALFASRRFPVTDTVSYIVAQLVGGLLGSIFFYLSVGMDAVTIGGLGATAPAPGITFGMAVLAEVIGTFVLMMVIMGVAVDEKAPPGFAGLIIGLTVAGIITTIGGVTGSSLNPARSFGPAMGDLLLGGPDVMGAFPIYIVGPIIGALVAVFFYDWIVKED